MIREQITPIGDGNFHKTIYIIIDTHKRTDNSDRRRKLDLSSIIRQEENIIREQITPIGDGNIQINFEYPQILQ